jgi:hypothetical protein
MGPVRNKMLAPFNFVEPSRSLLLLLLLLLLLRRRYAASAVYDATTSNATSPTNAATSYRSL